MDHDDISTYATLAASVLFWHRTMPTGEILALIKENNKNPIWAAVPLPIYSVMHTVILIMETPLPDQGTAVGESEGFCLM